MAVLLTWALIASWTAIGLAALHLGRFRKTVTTLLLAPAVGFAVLVLPVCILVRFGVPVRVTAVPVGGVLLTGALAVLWRGRPAADLARRLWVRARAFGAILGVTFVLTAWPLFGYGFDWVANGNDDMACYCVNAAALRDHGFAAVPTLEDLRGARDGTQSFWPFYILLQVRPGSELLLAITATWTGLTPQQVFMPVIVGFNLALVGAASALAAAGAGRRAALFTGGLLGVSAATTYGVVQQVIAQVAGLGLLCAALTLVAGRFRHLRAGVLVRRAGVCGLVFAGLVVFYPEVIPLLVGGCVALGVRDLARGRMDRRHLAHAGAAIAVMVALLPVYLYGAACFLLLQSGAGGNTQAVKELFPFYLTPRAPALLWGLLPITGGESDRFQNVCIGLGFLLAAAVVVPAARDLLRRRAFGAVLCVIGALVAVLYVRGMAFGLFKSAMFAQPFLWAVVGAGAARCGPRAARVAVPLLLALAALNARTQLAYVNQSRGKDYAVELPLASSRDTLTEFRTLYRQRVAAERPDRVLLATENNVLLKLWVSEARGVPVSEVGVAPLSDFASVNLGLVEVSPWIRFHGDERASLLATRAALADSFRRNRSVVRDPDTGRTLHEVRFPIVGAGDAPPRRVLVAAGVGGLSVLNRQQFPESGSPVVCAPLSDVRNFAVLCDATGARQNYLGLSEPEHIALFRLEADLSFRGRTMAGVGRAMVLDVLNPSPRVRVVVSHTGSFRSDPAARVVAPVQVVGDRRVPLGAIGSGSARLVSAPLSPQESGAGRLVAVDFGPDARRNPNRLAGAERLWGAELARDRRYLTGHAREVSVLSEEEYAAFRPPAAVAAFPDDLTHPHLEYSGLFEEGWVGTAFKLRLTQPAPDQEAVIRGTIPQVAEGAAFRSEMTVLIDGAAVETRELGTGAFEVRAPGGAGAGPRWVEVHFSRAQTLPDPDGRRVAARLTSVGFEAPSRPPERLAAFPADLSHPKSKPVGIHPDGWSASALAATLWQPGPGHAVVVRGQVPEVAGNFGYRTRLTVSVDGVELATRDLGTGDFEVRVPAGNAAGARRVECRFSNSQALPPPDGRTVGALLRSVGFEAAEASR